MATRAGTGERYATQMGELWSVLTRTLSQLDRLAADPDGLWDETVPDTLRRLQYSLHTAGERVYGLAPPAGAQTAHTELWAALAGARDATAEIAEALEEGEPDGALMLIHEWRCTLFRVRLARLRLSTPRPAAETPEGPARRRLTIPLVATVLVVCGAGVFALGAVTGHWPIWAAGMLAVCGSTLVYRP